MKTRTPVPFKVRDPNRPLYSWDDPVRWKAQFENDATNPRSWQEEARRLACAANTLMWVLSQHPAPCDLDTSRYLSIKSILFLYALATENLIKAVWIARGGQPLFQGVLAKKLGTHKLSVLAHQAGLTMSKREDALLNWLQQLIESGKYPISRSVERQLRLPGFGLPTSVPRILALLQRLENDLTATPPPYQPSPAIDYAKLGISKGTTRS